MDTTTPPLAALAEIITPARATEGVKRRRDSEPKEMAG
jgi:hypothetical protein